MKNINVRPILEQNGTETALVESAGAINVCVTPRTGHRPRPAAITTARSAFAEMTSQAKQEPSAILEQR
jgi:hypothetical protein